MGQTTVTVPESRDELNKRELVAIDGVLQIIQFIQSDLEDLETKVEDKERLQKIKDSAEKVEEYFLHIQNNLPDGFSEEQLRDIDEFLSKTIIDLQKLSGSPKKEGEKRSKFISEVREIAKEPKSSIIKVPQDLWRSRIQNDGDSLLSPDIDEKRKKTIKKLQAEGNLLAGTLDGLSGGSAYLKVFMIALAQTLEEQSKHFNTYEEGTGVPKDLLPSFFGSRSEDVDEKVFKKVRMGNTDRRSPLILIHFEDLAKKMSPSGKRGGGRDGDFIRQYIDKLATKQYLYLDPLDKSIIYGVPLIKREIAVYSLRGKGNLIGGLYSLSPQFSKFASKYIGMRSDSATVLLGDGKLKSITVNLADVLWNFRGIDQRGKKSREKGPLFKFKKKELLTRISGGRKDYSQRPGLLEKDFREAVQKAKDLKIIVRYKEEKSPGGEVFSVFYWNENYLEREET